MWTMNYPGGPMPNHLSESGGAFRAWRTIAGLLRRSLVLEDPRAVIRNKSSNLLNNVLALNFYNPKYAGEERKFFSYFSTPPQFFGYH